MTSYVPEALKANLECTLAGQDLYNGIVIAGKHFNVKDYWEILDSQIQH